MRSSSWDQEANCASLLLLRLHHSLACFFAVGATPSPPSSVWKENPWASRLETHSPQFSLMINFKICMKNSEIHKRCHSFLLSTSKKACLSSPLSKCQTHQSLLIAFSAYQECLQWNSMVVLRRRWNKYGTHFSMEKIKAQEDWTPHPR